MRTEVDPRVISAGDRHLRRCVKPAREAPYAGDERGPIRSAIRARSAG